MLTKIANQLYFTVVNALKYLFTQYATMCDNCSCNKTFTLLARIITVASKVMPGMHSQFAFQ